MSAFKIVEDRGNRTGTLPPHWEIKPKASDDSIITVWDSKEMAEECVKFLEQYPLRRSQNG